MLKGLSEDEISSVMNNKKYEDAPMKKILSQLRSGIQKDKTSSTSIDVSILEEEIDDLKTRVESAKDEAAAAEEALRFVQKEFADFEEAQILGFFDAISKVHGVLRKDEVWARAHTHDHPLKFLPPPPTQQWHESLHDAPKGSSEESTGLSAACGTAFCFVMRIGTDSCRVSREVDIRTREQGVNTSRD